MIPTLTLEAWYSHSLWDQVAEDPAERDAFLERFAGLSILIGEKQTVEEWVAERIKYWTHFAPVSAHLIDNRKTGPADVLWGPGPLGRTARRLASLVVAGWMGA